MESLQNYTDSGNTTDPCLEELDGDFDFSLHIVSVFTMITFSAIGVFIPIMLRRCNTVIFNFENPVLLFGKFFGGGVMVATAFIHILPDAVDTLTSPCLPEFFTTKYPVLPYLLVMLAALSLHILEWCTVRTQLTKIKLEDKKRQTDELVELGEREAEDKVSDKSDESNNGGGVRVSMSASTTSSSNSNCQDEGHGHNHAGHSHAHRDQVDIDMQMEMKSTVSTITTEVAVAVHSVIIGLALGVAKSEFVSLWIALSFHQFFEGIGIGFKVADTKSYSNFATILTGILFSFTTPIGIAIGIGVTVAASKASATNALIAEGIFESISAGLLLYTALVSLTVEEFGSSVFQRMTLRGRLVSFIAFYLGAGAMAMIGGWA